MLIAHNLGFPRIGTNRAMKKAVEAYWKGELSLSQLQETGGSIQKTNWEMQAKAGIEYIPVGDFSWYDHVLDTSVMVGAVPSRYQPSGKPIDLDTLFCMARGIAPNKPTFSACEMTKWFDTNYHYIVPELEANQNFYLGSETLFEAVNHATQLGYRAKPVLLGPLSFLWLGKTKGSHFDKLSLLDNLIVVYTEILQKLNSQNAEWIQIDEPILGLDLPHHWQRAFYQVYQQLNANSLQLNSKLLLTTYFSALEDNLTLASELPLDGLHVDLCAAPEQLEPVLQNFPTKKVLSLGLINGRNVWRANLKQALSVIDAVRKKRGDQLWISGSCSFLHVPLDLDQEQDLDPEIKKWLAFAKQKCAEIAFLVKAGNQGVETIQKEISDCEAALQLRRSSTRIHNPTVKSRIADLTPDAAKRQNPFSERMVKQQKLLQLPLFPTTTIGSFPQTPVIRHIRQEFKTGKMNQKEYEDKIRQEIALTVRKQEDLNLDVLVHGEAERNDMVEYFGELLDGFVFTQHGWVQSYGSRCVKPPIIYGDVSRPHAMTVSWSQYAQSLTKRPMKGMLTGPVTILAWSFVRDDQSDANTALQIALALRDEVVDLETAGIHVIQIDEPAFRERLPLRKKNWQAYLDWAVRCFRITSCGVKDQTQIHTHMCYSEFNDIIASIAALDADVITLESSRSNMELLEAFENFSYPNGIGPGVYDIHSPRIPECKEIIELMDKALHYLPPQKLWVNPDCGLKTRQWSEVEVALRHMVEAAKALREQHVWIENPTSI